MTEPPATLDELKQRSHDYALWFVQTIVGTISYLCIGAGGLAFVGGLMALQPMTILIGSVLFVGGILLSTLLVVARILKDIRLNTREMLASQRQTYQMKNVDADEATENSPPCFDAPREMQTAFFFFVGPIIIRWAEQGGRGSARDLTGFWRSLNLG